MQKQYSAKPLKVLGEQYLAAAQPPPIGLCTCTLGGPAAAPPHVHTQGTVIYVQETDWIVYNRTGTRLEGVWTDADFSEDFNVPGTA